ncbi:hypothetical protein [Sodalis sp. C49]|uniref:hypothetical protein n=1 Tax=Sodalis sp. C49 TaxID=3228929 RepID=UPI003965B3A2
MKDMVAYLKPKGKRFIIMPIFPDLSETTGTANTNYVVEINQLLLKKLSRQLLPN